MKKQILSLIATAATGSMFAQLPVSTAPQNKKIILEEYTGIYCGYCPDGHSKANAIYAANPGNCVLINIHSGGYANVAVGEPDLKTTIGTAIDGMAGMNIQGYPAGSINRRNFGASASQNTASPYGMAQDRNTWNTTANTVKAEAAYCNVAVEGSVDAATRVLTYTAQVYYTANSPASTNSLTVVMLEDYILGPQHNYGNPLYNASNYNADGSYNHNHVLRKGLTAGNFGITIPTTTSGTTFSTTGTYTIPLTYGVTGKTNPCMLGNIYLAAYVTETATNTINGASGPINITNIANTNDAAVSTLIADAEVCSGNLQPFKFNLSNNGSANLTSAVISYSATGGSVQTYTFNGNLAPFTQTVVSLPAYSFPASATNTLSVMVSNVNGGTDQNAANDVVVKSIPLTTKVANSLNLNMLFKQDQYGSESTWTISEEVSGTVVASGGPYSDLSASGTLTHTVNFNVNPNTCYKVVVNDAYGDGFNAGYGAGNYQIKAGTTVIYTMNGVMTDMDLKLFRTSVSAGLQQISSTVSNVSVYPSPAKNSASISLDLVQNENISINIVNAVGQNVYSQSLNNLSAGNHTINLNTENWANGIYNISIGTQNGTANQKLIIAK